MIPLASHVTERKLLVTVESISEEASMFEKAVATVDPSSVLSMIASFTGIDESFLVSQAASYACDGMGEEGREVAEELMRFVVRWYMDENEMDEMQSAWNRTIEEWRDQQ